jgi:hypothetical protein
MGSLRIPWPRAVPQEDLVDSWNCRIWSIELDAGYVVRITFNPSNDIVFLVQSFCHGIQHDLIT